MLERALKRIKIPPKMIKLIIYLFKNREIKAIIENGFTDTIIAKDSIDQEETISPLLWIIFYNPLLTKLNQTPKKTLNLINNLAFMDDLNLLSQDKFTLQKLLNITSQFLTLNNISINP